MAQRPAVLAALGIATIGGYYLYQAGGSPKVAEKKMEADAHAASANIKSHIPGTAKELEADARLRASQIGSKIDSYVDSAKAQGKDVQKQLEGLSADARKQVDSLSQDARKQYDNASTEMRARYNQAMSEGKKLESTMRSYASDAEANLEAARKEAAARMNSAVDSFDKNVTEGASKAKSGISSWFGGGK